jgi:hypothetical protein
MPGRGSIGFEHPAAALTSTSMQESTCRQRSTPPQTEGAATRSLHGGMRFTSSANVVQSPCSSMTSQRCQIRQSRSRRRHSAQTSVRVNKLSVGIQWREVANPLSVRTIESPRRGNARRCATISVPPSSEVSTKMTCEKRSEESRRNNWERKTIAKPRSRRKVAQQSESEARVVQNKGQFQALTRLSGRFGFSETWEIVKFGAGI